MREVGGRNCGNRVGERVVGKGVGRGIVSGRCDCVKDVEEGTVATSKGMEERTVGRGSKEGMWEKDVGEDCVERVGETAGARG